MSMEKLESMGMPHPEMPAVRFGPFEADLRTGELHRNGRKLRLPNQSFIALSMLLTRPRELVTREELCARLWPADGATDNEQGLNAVINRLRDALGDAAANPKFIETLPKRGYRFIAPIDSGAPAEASTQSTTAHRDRAKQTAAIKSAEKSGPARRIALAAGLALAVLCVAVVLALRVIATRQDEVRAADRQLMPLTTLPGEERAPSFSPDGSRIAFAWNGSSAGSSSGFDLYVKTLDSEQPLRLTQHPARWLSPTWSPDGTQIAFARWTNDADSGIFLIPALGGAERRITTGVGGHPFMQLTWSPDGKLLAYSGWDARNPQRIQLLSLDGLKSQPLQSAPQCWDAVMPAFSPDGKYLAFVCPTSVAVYGIHVAALAASELRIVRTMMGNPQGVAWSSDSTHLIVANDSGDGGALWQLSLNGELVRMPFGEEASTPAVTSDGARIAYVRGSSPVDVWRLDLHAAQPEGTATRLVYSTRTEMTPQYSPDGERIVFQSNRSGTSEVWIADANGESPVRLTSFNGPLTGAPSWCSDGRRVAFDSRAGGVSAIYIEDIDERLPRKLRTNRENLALPAWSDDCRWIVASDGKTELFRIPAAGGPAVRLTQQDSYYAQVIGERVVFNVKETSGVVLWVRPIEGGDEHALTNMPRLAYRDAWAVTPSGIYYTTVEGESPALHFYDFATQAPRRITQLPREPMPVGGLGLSVSTDGRWILYTQADDAQSDIMLMSTD